MVKAAFQGNFWSVRNETFYTKTPIDVTVPKGGYLRLTNDSLQSVPCYIYNMFDIMFSTYNFVDGILSSEKLSDEQINKITEHLVDHIISEYKLKYIQKYMDKISSDVTEEVTLSTATSVITNIIQDAESLLDDIDWDIDELIKTALGTAESIGEGIFTKLTGFIGTSLNVVFGISKGSDLIIEISDWIKSMNRNYGFAVFEPNEKGFGGNVLQNKDVIVKHNGLLPESAVVQTFRVSPEIADPIVYNGKQVGSPCEILDITLLSDGQKIQPSGEVEVSLPVPDGFSNALTILQQSDDGQWAEIPYSVRDNEIVLNVSHFCLFAIVDQMSVDQSIMPPPTTVPPTTVPPTTVPPTTVPPTTVPPTTVPPTTVPPATVPPTTVPPTTVPPTTVPSVSLGDVDNNGKINSADARMILRYAARLTTFDARQRAASDINADGRINSADARIILRIAAKLDDIKHYQ